MAAPVTSRRTRSLRRDTRGAVAVEMALVSALLVTLMAQALDFGWYVYCALQVRMAAQAAVAQAVKTCDKTKWPAATNCTTDMTSAAQQVSLGSAISMSVVSAQEGYYCASGNSLVAFSGTVTSTSTCPSSTEKPGYYVPVQTSYTFAPLFPGLTVVSAFAGTLHGSAWMRLG